MQNWTYIRFIRLAAAIFIGIMAFYLQEYEFLIVSALFFAQSIFNFGCCGAEGCAPTKKNTSKGDLSKFVKEYK